VFRCIHLSADYCDEIVLLSQVHNKDNKKARGLFVLSFVHSIEEGRAASKSPHLKFGYFLSISQQTVSADIIPNSAVGIFSPKTEGTKT
jgi:hypothetical protein